MLDASVAAGCPREHRTADGRPSGSMQSQLVVKPLITRCAAVVNMADVTRPLVWSALCTVCSRCTQPQQCCGACALGATRRDQGRQIGRARCRSGLVGNRSPALAEAVNRREPAARASPSHVAGSQLDGRPV